MRVPRKFRCVPGSGLPARSPVPLSGQRGLEARARRGASSVLVGSVGAWWGGVWRLAMAFYTAHWTIFSIFGGFSHKSLELQTKIDSKLVSVSRK